MDAVAHRLVEVDDQLGEVFYRRLRAHRLQPLYHVDHLHIPTQAKFNNTLFDVNSATGGRGKSVKEECSSSILTDDIRRGSFGQKTGNIYIEQHLK